MENKAINTNFYSSVREATVEILGRQEANKVFNAILEADQTNKDDTPSIPRDFLTGICDEFSIQYQPNTASGLLLRIGDAAFMLLRRKIKVVNELGSIENRLRPFNIKFETSLQSLAEFLEQAMRMPIKTKSTEQKCYCLEISKKRSSQSGEGLDLYFFAGILRAFGNWLDSRRDYQITVESNKNGHDHDLVCLYVHPPQ